MRILVCLLTALLVTGLSTETYAAQKVHKTIGSKASHKAKSIKKVIKKIVKKPQLSLNKKVKNTKPIVKNVGNVLPKFANNSTDDKKYVGGATKYGSDDNKIVTFDFKDNIKKLSETKDDDRNVFLQITKKDKDDEKGHHDGGHGQGNNDHVNAVPVPAAVWLFGSALLGLVGAKRRAA